MRFALLAIAILLIPSNMVMAHGLGSDIYSGPTRSLKFYYSDGTPAAYAEVLVYAPGETEVEYQNGRTDAKGYFTFTPQKEGKWRVVMNDGMGHRTEVNLSYAKSVPASPAPTPSAKTNQSSMGIPEPGKIILGLSLIANLMLGGMVLRRKQ